MTTKSLVLLSGEGTTIPMAEARALFLCYDPSSRFASPEDRLLIVESACEPSMVARRIAFARRVGTLVEDTSSLAPALAGRRVRVRGFSLKGGHGSDDYGLLDGLDVTIDLENPDYELTVINGAERYVALSRPAAMRQAWSRRRPRKRAFFHPSAIFPKLSRALVNLTRCREGEVLLDPFCGTGSIPLEAGVLGLNVVAADRAAKMARGSLANMRQFGEEWLGVLVADAFRTPIARVDGVATDIPYGRAASTGGSGAAEVLRMTTELLPSVMRRGGVAVLMHPEQFALEPPGQLALLEEHRLYIHKRLTRVISILRRR